MFFDFKGLLQPCKFENWRFGELENSIFYVTNMAQMYFHKIILYFLKFYLENMKKRTSSESWFDLKKEEEKGVKTKIYQVRTKIQKIGELDLRIDELIHQVRIIFSCLQNIRLKYQLSYLRIMLKEQAIFFRRCLSSFFVIFLCYAKSYQVLFFFSKSSNFFSKKAKLWITYHVKSLIYLSLVARPRSKIYLTWFHCQI